MTLARFSLIQRTRQSELPCHRCQTALCRCSFQGNLPELPLRLLPDRRPANRSASGRVTTFSCRCVRTCMCTLTTATLTYRTLTCRDLHRPRHRVPRRGQPSSLEVKASFHPFVTQIGKLQKKVIRSTSEHQPALKPVRGGASNGHRESGAAADIALRLTPAYPPGTSDHALNRHSNRGAKTPGSRPRLTRRHRHLILGRVDENRGHLNVVTS